MTWDGPVIYKIPDRFHNIYKEHVPDKVGKVKQDKITLGDIVKKKESGEEAIAKFQEKYMRTTPKRKGSGKASPKEVQSKKRKTKEPLYSEDDIKLNWKTLMFFSKRDWKGSRFPLPKRQINKDDREMFYIGRSDIEKKKVYFIVSGHIIPDGRDSHVFPNSFFRQMVYNKEYDIPQESKDILFQNVQYTIRNTIEYIYPSIVNDTKQWQCKLKGGRFLQPKSLQWIQDNFQKDFEDTYEQLISDEFLDKPIPCPKSKGQSLIQSEETKVTIPLNMRGEMEVKYCFGEKDYCAFGNMANAMYHLNDSKAPSFFFSNRFQTMSDMIEQYTSSEGK